MLGLNCMPGNDTFGSESVNGNGVMLIGDHRLLGEAVRRARGPLEDWGFLIPVDYGTEYGMLMGLMKGRNRAEMRQEKCGLTYLACPYQCPFAAYSWASGISAQA